MKLFLVALLASAAQAFVPTSAFMRSTALRMSDPEGEMVFAHC